MVAATAIPSEPVPSGTPLQIDLAESFTFASGSTINPMPSRRRLAVYSTRRRTAQRDGRRACGHSFAHPHAFFAARRGHRFLAGRLPANPEAAPRASVRRGQEGSSLRPTANGLSFRRVRLPRTLPVDLTPIPADEFPLAVPVGHTLFRAFVLDLHGAPLSRDLQVTIPGAGNGAGWNRGVGGSARRCRRGHAARARRDCPGRRRAAWSRRLTRWEAAPFCCPGSAAKGDTRCSLPPGIVRLCDRRASRRRMVRRLAGHCSTLPTFRSRRSAMQRAVTRCSIFAQAAFNSGAMRPPNGDTAAVNAAVRRPATSASPIVRRRLAHRPR